MNLPSIWLQRVYKFAVPTSALLVFFALSLLYVYGDRSLYFALLESWGAAPFSFPFLDISGSLAAWECARQGVQLVVADPGDGLQRSFHLSPHLMSRSGCPL